MRFGRGLAQVLVAAALAASVGPLSAFADDYLDVLHWNTDKPRLVQPKPTGCVGTSCAMILKDTGLPINVDVAVNHITDPQVGAKMRRGAEVLHRNGIPSNLYLPNDIKLSTVKDIVKDGTRSAVVAIRRPGEAIGHAIVVDGVRTIAGTEYYVIRDPWPGAPNGGSYLRPRSSVDPHIRNVLEPLPQGARPLPHLDPQRHHAGGAFAGADDAAKAGRSAAAGADEAADAGRRAASGADDATKVGKARAGVGRAMQAMEVAGKLATAYEVATAVGQLADYFGTIYTALDPTLSDEEANTLFEEAQKIANTLIESGVLGAVFERHPAVAVAWATWVLSRYGSEWVLANTETGQFINRAAGEFADRQVSAWDRFKDWWSGKEALDEQQKREICEKFKGALANGHVKLRESWMDDFLSREDAIKHACWRLTSGESLTDMLDGARVSAAPTSPPQPGPTQEKKTADTNCDPAQVAKSKPKLDKGFVAVEYKGATAWIGGQNPDCPAFGPAAKGVDDGLGGEAKRKAAADEQKRKADEAKTADAAKEKADAAKRAAARVAEACHRAKEIFERGHEHYLAGRVSEFRVALVNAERELDPLKDQSACPHERRKIAKGAGQADLLENVIKAADQALANCEERRLRKLSGLLAKTNHPFVTQLRSRVDRMAVVASKVEKADEARANSRFADADTLYRQAAAGLNAEPGTCAGLAKHVRDGQQALRTASLAPKANSSGLAETNACKAKIGKLGTAVPDSNSLSGYRCDCEQPYRLEGSACVRQKSETELAAERDARCPSGYKAGPVDRNGDFKCHATKETADADCRAKFGAGHYAGPISNEGSYYCLPTKETADAACRTANPNYAGIYAGPIKTDGSYGCLPTKAAANAWCRQANPRMQGVYAGAIRADGRFNCYGRQPVARTPSPQPQPQHDTASSTAAAAVAGAVIQGVIGAIGSRRSGGGAPPQRSTGCHPGAVGGVFRDCQGRMNSGGGSGLRHDPRTSISGY